MSSGRLLAILGIVLAGAGVCTAAPGQANELWYGQVEPLLDRSCFKCHGGVRQKSGLDLRSLENILRGGDRGPAIIPGQPEQSHLYQFVHKGSDPHMPQEERKQLSDQEMAALGNWIRTLPGTNIVSLAYTNQTDWVEAYLKALHAMQKPIWTPPTTLSTHKVIDRFIELGWKQRSVEPSAACDDRTFARRVYLDLCGRIPTTREVEAFLSDRTSEKRARLADQLLASADYARHMREVFDVVLLERRGEHAEDQRHEHGWFAFLERAFAENYPWDKIVRELIEARPSVPEDRGCVWYLYERKDNYQAMAEALAPIAFGVQIGCAQCHNHPLVAEVEQRHYWGLVAAFNRSKNVDCTNGIGVAESAIGGFVSFANLKKESQPAQLAFLNGTVVPEKRPADGEKEVDSADKYLVPPPAAKQKPSSPAVPKFSRRAALAQAATENNPQLAKAFVNRIWALLLGRGFVMPVDELDSQHLPSHPDLLDWLAKDFESHGYDIKRLVKEIVLSQTYQLDSHPRGSRTPPAEAFARGPEKPLSAEELYHSFLVATGNQAPGADDQKDDVALRRAFLKQFPDLFASDYNATLQQATFLSNSPLIDTLLEPRNGNTMAQLMARKTSEERVELAYRSVLGRDPGADELLRCKAFLDGRPKPDGAKDLLWALLAGAEFQMNH